MDVTARLAEYVAGVRSDAVPADVLDRAAQATLDVLGIALRASVDAASAPSVRDAVLAVAGDGGSTAIGVPRTLDPAHSALLNGTLAHSLDFDDTHREGSVHPGAAIVPTVLALAEEHGAAGRQALAAIVVGYDVTCRVSRALAPASHYRRGFHPTGTAGVFGATAAGANLLGLSPAELTSAFGINGSQAAGTMQFLDNGAWNKHLHPGLAAHNAIFALELARRGFVGAARSLEGRDGVLRAYSDAGRPEAVLDGLGERFEILQTGIKPYPACRYAHAPLDALIEIAAVNDLRPDEILSVTVGMSDAGRDIIGVPIERKRRPRNVVDGQFSMPFLAAVALTRGRMAWGDYELIDDEDVNRLAAKIAVATDAEANAVYPERWLASVEVVTTRGTFADRRWTTRGEPEAPLGWDELEGKFEMLTDCVLTSRGRGALVAAVRGLADLESVAPLSENLRAVTRS